ncbi:Translation initiation factor IF-2, mitochondrial [Cichlidogyrus casuarinus]|uniref:Translation initiation factor IF-2, mitochondrial n=1 Tax=Cichlidogyrus casuarinus TaxID=1844966 RepID=A0ABD2QDP8_9PLAT
MLISFVADETNTSPKQLNRNTKLDDVHFLQRLIGLIGYTPILNSKTSKQDLSLQKSSEIDIKPRPPPDPVKCSKRPPVVAIMGHVDHGKTTLLDALRSTKVVDSEFGGITQHLSAFTLSIAETQKILQQFSPSKNPQNLDALYKHVTFLDTPGHATFTAIRARGAKVTDIVILVVAADDGVMPQTVESIRLAEAGNSQIIVAINKMDKPEADPQFVMNELASHGIVVEQLGGDVQCVEISALLKTNLFSLLDAITTQAELMDIKAEFDGPCEAVVLESRTVPGLGKVATLLVTRGTLKRLNAAKGIKINLVASECICKPRIVRNDSGETVDFVTPGQVAEVAGWQTLPSAGDIVLEAANEIQANEVIRARKSQRMIEKAEEDSQEIEKKYSAYNREYKLLIERRSSLKSQREARKASREFQSTASSLLPQSDNQTEGISLLVKTDVHGTLEAIQDLLATFPSDICPVNLIYAGVGPLTEAEVDIAQPFNATIMLFNTNSLSTAADKCQVAGLKIRPVNIIYRFAEMVKQLAEQSLAPTLEDQVLGEAEVLNLFWINETRKTKVCVAGSRCVKGTLKHSKSPEKFAHKEIPGGIYYRVLREDKVLAEGLVSRSIRHEKQVVDSVKTDVECGLALGQMKYGTVVPYEDVAVGDRIECYCVIEALQTIDWQIGYADSD